jgi:hypothetical protein
MQTRKHEVVASELTTTCALGHSVTPRAARALDIVSVAGGAEFGLA